MKRPTTIPAVPAISPEPVTAAVAREDTWAPIISTVGSLTAVQGVTLSAQLDGTVASIAFQPGSSVKSGDLLVQMDISSEEAQLRAAEATVELARLNLERSRELLAGQTISNRSSTLTAPPTSRPPPRLTISARR